MHSMEIKLLCISLMLYVSSSVRPQRVMYDRRRVYSMSILCICIRCASLTIYIWAYITDEGDVLVDKGMCTSVVQIDAVQEGIY